MVKLTAPLNRENLIKFRQAHDLTQAEMALRIGVSLRTYLAIERGEAEFKPYHMAAAVRFYVHTYQWNEKGQCELSEPIPVPAETHEEAAHMVLGDIPLMEGALANPRLAAKVWRIGANFKPEIMYFSRVE